MRIALPACLVLAALAWAGDEPAMPPMPGQPDPKAAAAVAAADVAWEAGDRIIIVGDLLAPPNQPGFAPRLHDQLLASRKDLDLVVRQLANHAIPAARWRDALKTELAQRPSAQVVVIGVGMGDALAALNAKATAIPSRDEYRAVVEDMAKAAQAAGAAVVLCTPAVLGDKPVGGPFTAELDGYAEAVRALAPAIGAELCDLRKPQMELLQARNAKATRELNVVSKALGQLRSEAMDAATTAVAQAVAAAVKRIPWSIRVPGIPFKGTAQAEIQVRRIAPERVELRYTTDGSEVGATAKLYQKPFAVTETTQIRVVATAKDGGGSRTATGWWTAYRSRASESVAGEMLPGLWVDHYPLKRWRDPIANLDAMKADATAVWPNFELDAVSRMAVHRWPNEWFALRFTGWFMAPYDGIYRFATYSDDATRLWFGDTLVVRNDNLHAMRWAHGSVELNKGLHPVTLWYAQGPSLHGLEVHVALPGQRYQRLPDLLLRRTPAPPVRKPLSFEVTGGADDAGEPDAAPNLPGAPGGVPEPPRPE
ncbi:MAG: chitobiase/beta-hexosaminidase C-terminal domain-containing protein [Planctomycetes bacterium]|nr:chitobiase/beta-hexosaminidase C-terminal domain-containing protein [Planctomycetota bacterium]